MKRRDTNPLYEAWRKMRRRCTNPKDAAWCNYGARGITVCSRWDSFEQFCADMGDRPSPRHQIDRVNNDGPYSPDNCRWALPSENSRNRRNNRIVVYRDESATLAEWCERLSLSYYTTAKRIENGWDIRRAFETPIRTKAARASLSAEAVKFIRETDTHYREVAKMFGVSGDVIHGIRSGRTFRSEQL